MRNTIRTIYVTATITASFIALTGTLTKPGDHLSIAISTPFVLWFVLFLLFIWLSFLQVSQDFEFVITCVYHLICIGAILAFFSYLNSGYANILSFWTPFAIQLGIFLAVGFQECASVVSWRKVRGLFLSFLDGLRLLMGAEDERLPLWVVQPCNTLLAVTPIPVGIALRCSTLLYVMTSSLAVATPSTATPNTETELHPQISIITTALLCIS